MLNLFPLMRYRRRAKLNYTKEILANAKATDFSTTIETLLIQIDINTRKINLTKY